MERNTTKSLMIASVLLVIGGNAGAADSDKMLSTGITHACITSGGHIETSWAYNDGGARWGQMVSCVKVDDASTHRTTIASRRTRMARLCANAGGRFEQSWAYDDGGTQWGDTTSCSTGTGTVVCRGMHCSSVERWAAAPQAKTARTNTPARNLASAPSATRRR